MYVAATTIPCDDNFLDRFLTAAVVSSSIHIRRTCKQSKQRMNIMSSSCTPPSGQPIKSQQAAKREIYSAVLVYWKWGGVW